MNIWVIKCSEQREDGSTWHWRNYFHGLDDHRPTDTRYEFGGENWIRSHTSMQRIRDDLSRGDLIICYRRKGRQILGFTRLDSAGMEQRPGSGRYNLFDLIPAEGSFELDPPVRVAEDLYTSGCRPSCFQPGTRGTVWPVNRRDFDQIVACIRAGSPKRGDALQRWLRDAGYRRVRAGKSRSVWR
jgi:hypothetical protein